MRPWIWPDGELTVQRCGPDELTVGEIAVWFDGERLYAHRVVWTEGHRFATRSDWSLEPDSPADGHQLLGRAVAFRKGGVSYRLDSAGARLAGKLAAQSGRRDLVRRALRWCAQRLAQRPR